MYIVIIMCVHSKNQNVQLIFSEEINVAPPSLPNDVRSHKEGSTQSPFLLIGIPTDENNVK